MSWEKYPPYCLTKNPHAIGILIMPGLILKRMRHAKKSRLALGTLLLAEMLLAVLMAASPELHHFFHHDADDDDHDCAVTHMIKGDFSDGASVQTIAVGRRLPVMEHRLAVQTDDVWVEPLCLDNGVMEHAPPVMG